MKRGRLVNNLSLLIILSLMIVGCGKDDSSTTVSTIVNSATNEERQEEVEQSIESTSDKTKPYDELWIQDKRADSNASADAPFLEHYVSLSG